MIKAEVPGCKAQDIDISLHGNTLTISGEKKQEKEEKEKVACSPKIGPVLVRV